MLGKFLLRRELALGFTLIEVIVGVVIFAGVGSAIYSTYLQLSKLSLKSRLMTQATAIASEYLEIVRNLPQTQVGIEGGLPAGVLPAWQTISRDGKNWQVHYVIRNVDDPFDGVIGGTPNDTAPADYKLVVVEVSCLSCDNFITQQLSTQVAPKFLETTGDNGALFIQVVNANGQPVPGANIHVENNILVPSLTIDDTTNNDGMLQLVDVPPATESYHIVATKTGYTQDQTYPPGDPDNPNPSQPDATVVSGQVTHVTLIIDQLSQLTINSLTLTCAAVPYVDFNLKGNKLIGTEPNVLKYDQDLTTNAAGNLTVSNLDWDSYYASLLGDTYDLLGTIPLMPLNLAPNSSQDLKLVVQAAHPHSLHVVVRDTATQLPLSGASVKVTKPGTEEIKLTGRGYLRQTNWKGGSGQENFIDETKYFSDDGNIETNNPVGELKLVKHGNSYEISGELISSTFDTGAASNFTTIEWQPGDQPPETGEAPIRFQLATNNDNTTWNFIGPDGTAATYYTTSGQPVSAAHNGDRYLRYRVFLSTADDGYTPNLSDIAITFVSGCVPPGQAYFTGLSSAVYDLEISLAGYETATAQVYLTPNWVSREVQLLPQ